MATQGRVNDIKAFVAHGYGQVEANRLSGITYGVLEGQAPAFESNETDADPIAELENGMFLCIMPDANELGSPMGRVAVLPGNAPAKSAPFLVYSEKKIYDERLGYADFIDRAEDKVDGRLYPKLIGLTPDADVFTTNTIDISQNDAEGDALDVGKVLYIGDNGYLSTSAGTNTVVKFLITKKYTMPDGQPAVKVVSVNYDR